MTSNKISPSLFWNIIGDSFSRVFDISPKREIEGLWKSMLDQASEGVDYANHVGSLVTPFTADFLAPWGTVKVDLQDVSEISQQQAVLAGEKYVWSKDEIPSRGYISSGSSSGQFSKLSQIALGSGGFLSLADLPSSIDPGIGSSMEDWLTRFSLSGSVTPTLTDNGLELDLPWVQWSILSDNIKNSPVSAWEYVAVMKITDWDSGGGTERGISINSLGTFGSDWEIKVVDDGYSAHIQYGTFAVTRDVPLTLSGNTITRAVGSFRDDGFRSGMSLTLYNTPYDGTYAIANATATLLTLTTSPFLSPGTYVSAQLRTALATAHSPVGLRDVLRSASADSPVIVELVMQYKPMTATISGGIAVNGAYYTVPDMPVAVGYRQQVLDIYNQKNNISATLLSVFYKEGSMIDGSSPTVVNIGENFSYIYTFEQPILEARRFQICPWDIRPTANVQSWNGETLVVEIDEEFYGFAPEAAIINDQTFLLQSLSESIASYIPQDSVDIDISGDITIRPWFCDEIDFISPGKVSLGKKSPSNSLFVLGSRAVEVDLYETFGKLLQVAKQPDSLEYLNIIRGVHFGLVSRPTPNNVANAVAAIAGAPYSIYPGVIESITVIEGELGEEKLIEVDVSGNIVRCDPYWGDYILPVGTTLGAMDSLVDAVQVYDWISNSELVDTRLDDRWRKWSTFFVDVSDSLGVTPPGAAAIFSMLDRSRGRHTTFEFGITSNRTENPTEEFSRSNAFSQIETPLSVVQPHSIEDMTFDDYGEVVNNGVNFQTINSVEYSEEYQSGSDSYLDEYENLDMGQFIDVLRISDPMVISGTEMKWRSRPRKNESSYGVDFLGLYENFGPKPYSNLWCYDGATANLATYSIGRWYEVNTTNVGSVYTEGSDLSYAASGTNVLTSINKGYTWVSAAVTGATASPTFLKKGFGIGVGAQKLWVKGPSNTWSEQTFVNLVGDIMAIDVMGDTVWAFWSDINDIYLSKSTDGGATFPAGSAVISSFLTQPKDALFVSQDIGYLSTDSGLWRTVDGGTSWSSYDPGPFSSIVYLEDLDRLVVSKFLDTDVIVINSASDTPSTLGSFDTGATSLLQISGGKNYVFAVDSSGAFKSDDYGVTWAPSNTGISGTLSSISVDSTGLFRIAGGDSIWAWF